MWIYHIPGTVLSIISFNFSTALKVNTLYTDSPHFIDEEMVLQRGFAHGYIGVCSLLLKLRIVAGALMLGQLLHGPKRPPNYKILLQSIGGKRMHGSVLEYVSRVCVK